MGVMQPGRVAGNYPAEIYPCGLMPPRLSKRGKVCKLAFLRSASLAINIHYYLKNKNLVSILVSYDKNR